MKKNKTMTNLILSMAGVAGIVLTYFFIVQPTNRKKITDRYNQIDDEPKFKSTYPEDWNPNSVDAFNSFWRHISSQLN